MAGTFAFVRGAPGFQAVGDFKREGVNVTVDIPTTLEGGAAVRVFEQFGQEAGLPACRYPTADG
jgi:hypothetical protein